MTKKTESTRNGGKWTEARFRSFIKSALRQASMKWPPRNEAKKLARVERGVYLCADCGEKVPASLPPLEGRKKRRNNAAVDHREPVIDPQVGFTTWDEVIERMFCELDGFDILCWKCHTEKTQEEKETAKLRNKNNDK